MERPPQRPWTLTQQRAAQSHHLHQEEARQKQTHTAPSRVNRGGVFTSRRRNGRPAPGPRRTSSQTGSSPVQLRRRVIPSSTGQKGRRKPRDPSSRVENRPRSPRLRDDALGRGITTQIAQGENSRWENTRDGPNRRLRPPRGRSVNTSRTP